MIYVGSDMFEVNEGDIQGTFSASDIRGLVNSFLNSPVNKDSIDNILIGTEVERKIKSLKNEIEKFEQEI